MLFRKKIKIIEHAILLLKNTCYNVFLFIFYSFD
jgi:hypothetical protein